MARVLLLSATPAEDDNGEHLRPVRGLEESAARDKFGAHTLTENAAEADVILFAENYGAGWYFERVRAHPFTRRYREKCFIFSLNPFVIPFLPGVYTGIDQQDATTRTAAGFYVGQPPNEFATYTPPAAELTWLYSFMGSLRNAPVRQELARLSHPRGLVQDTAADFERLLNWKMSPEERQEYHRRYAELTQASKFVLCPRGVSASSIRLFETMRMGRVPVILSDDWRPPAGPTWDTFSIRVKEANVKDLPRLLEQRESAAAAMGEQARAVWEDWFSEEAAFHRVAEYCLEIKERRRIPEQWARWPVYLQYLRPFHFRRLLRKTLRREKTAGADPAAEIAAATAAGSPH